MLNDSSHNRKTSQPERVVRTSSTSLFNTRNSFMRDKSPSRSMLNRYELLELTRVCHENDDVFNKALVEFSHFDNVRFL